MSLTCPFGHLGEKPTGVAPPCPAASRSRYRDRMPISPGLDATAAWQAAVLAAQLGGSQANISAHLTRLKQSGVITSRAHGRAVYYRLTQSELGALLQTAGQLLAPIGQRAAEENDTTVRKTQRTNR